MLLIKHFKGNMKSQTFTKKPPRYPDPKVIQSMFSKVAANYDRGNTVLSLGIHHLWRENLVKNSGAKPGQLILDCATGTGDLAIAFKKVVGPTGIVIGTDFNKEMIATAPAKSQSKKLDIKFEIADVTDLPYENKKFDICSISFGIRNVGDPVKALKEMARVCKTGGRVIILEFGQMNLPIISKIYGFYSEKILPKLGGLVTGQHEAYDYLQKSSSAFPCREGFIEIMEESASFSEMTYSPVSLGIAYIYTGIVK
jgi:demethylmenaquinone methyltransferase / 2-methoxy-6-polyprenyl-1,4-benzoquinol methylase